VAVQLKTLMADGMATRKRQEREDERRVHRLAAHEHVVAPHEEADERDAEARERHELVAEDALREKAAMSSLITPIAGSTMM
jgi:hypothetical protein